MTGVYYAQTIAEINRYELQRTICEVENERLEREILDERSAHYPTRIIESDFLMEFYLHALGRYYCIRKDVLCAIIDFRGMTGGYHGAVENLDASTLALWEEEGYFL